MALEFEWDEAKAASNYTKHGIAFPQAIQAFRDPFAVERIDDRADYGEERIILLGMSDGLILHGPIPSAAKESESYRPAGRRNMSKTTTIAKIRPDGTVVEVLADGGERELSEIPARPMTDEEIHAAALTDPDAQPLAEADLARMPRVPRAKIIRRALGLSQEEFAGRFHIPLHTLRDWEQGRVEPDPPARAYLTVIARDPEGVQRALRSRP